MQTDPQHFGNTIIFFFVLATLTFLAWKFSKEPSTSKEVPEGENGGTTIGQKAATAKNWFQKNVETKHRWTLLLVAWGLFLIISQGLFMPLDWFGHAPSYAAMSTWAWDRFLGLIALGGVTVAIFATLEMEKAKEASKWIVLSTLTLLLIFAPIAGSPLGRWVGAELQGTKSPPAACSDMTTYGTSCAFGSTIMPIAVTADNMLPYLNPLPQYGDYTLWYMAPGEAVWHQWYPGVGGTVAKYGLQAPKNTVRTVTYCLVQKSTETCK